MTSEAAIEHSLGADEYRNWLAAKNGKEFDLPRKASLDRVA
jgi:hypothetical protein